MQNLARFIGLVLVGAVVAGCYVPGRGYAESQFDLVLDSRLPKFFDPTGQISPTRYKARVEFYSSPDSVRVIIYEPLGHKAFDKHGKCWWHPKGYQPGTGSLRLSPTTQLCHLMECSTFLSSNMQNHYCT